MEDLLNVKAYLIFIPVAIGLTIFTARFLFKNSMVFMLDIFNGREKIAGATNQLFEIGFYLLNVGMALLILKTNPIQDNIALVELLSFKIGGFAVYLGVMLFLNLYLFFRGKRKARQNRVMPIRIETENQ